VIRVPTLEQGRIVWAELSSLDGTKKKRRPGVIVTPTSEIGSGQAFVVAAATTKFTEPMPEDHVPLPWHPQGNVRTRLNRPTVAVCTWLCEIREEDVVNFGGIVPPKTLRAILDILNGASD
jgi:mRNA-degrading endonuclease toxin of MazEF toxin-antitoxin module